MSHPSAFIRNFTATAAAIAANRIVKCDSTTQTLVLQSAAAADNHIGVSEGVAVAASERVDVILNGPAVVTAGAAFAAGVALTSDATGRAIAAAPAAGANVRVVGYAIEQAAAAGDLVLINVVPSTVQG